MAESQNHGRRWMFRFLSSRKIIPPPPRAQNFLVPCLLYVGPFLWTREDSGNKTVYGFRVQERRGSRLIVPEIFSSRHEISRERPENMALSREPVRFSGQCPVVLTSVFESMAGLCVQLVRRNASIPVSCAKSFLYDLFHLVRVRVHPVGVGALWMNRGTTSQAIRVRCGNDDARSRTTQSCRTRAQRVSISLSLMWKYSKYLIFKSGRKSPCCCVMLIL